MIALSVTFGASSPKGGATGVSVKLFVDPETAGRCPHWQRLLDEDRSTSVAAIAKAEGMDVTQVRRIMRLTLLAPAVIERLVGAPDILLEQVMRRSWSNGWNSQVMALANRD